MPKHLFCKYGLIIYLICLSPIVRSQIVSFEQKNIAIKALFDSLTTKTQVDIAYDVNAFNPDSLIDVNYQSQHALQIVQDVLNKNAVDINYSDGQIVISKRLVSRIVPKTIRITGTLYDEADSTVLPLVNISVSGKPLGTITNGDGQYEFKLPMEYANGQLAFSFLGYNTAFKTIPNTDAVIDVVLQATSVKLDEVEVTYKDPDEIVNNLRLKHKDNYFLQQTVLEGFFRESIKQDGTYVQVSEAIIKLIKPGYSAPSNLERVKFIKGRKKNDLQSMDLIDFKLEGGPFQFSRVDIARYQDFYSSDNILYKYYYDGVAILNDELVYKVRFRPISDDGNLLYNGVLFIHSESFALVRSEFELTKKALKSSGKSLIRKASRKVKVKPLRAKYYIDYRQFENKWILNRIEGEIVVRINDKNHKVNSIFTAVTELLISDCKVDSKFKMKPSELYKSKYVLADHIKETDEEFWKNYNIIRPDQALEMVFKKTKVVSK
jgi:hypothetical protein